MTDKDTEDGLNGVGKEAAHFPIEESETDCIITDPKRSY